MSTGKTGNLQLNQWILSDPFLMEEFNSDNRAIDAAVAALRLSKTEIVKVKEVITSAQAASLEIGVSDIDWSQYFAVILQFRLIGSGTMLLKLGTGGPQYGYQSSGTSSIPGFSYVNAAGNDAISMLFPFKDGTQQIGAFTLDTSNYNITGGYSSGSNYSTLTKIFLNTANTNLNWFTSPGSRVTIWGVK